MSAIGIELKYDLTLWCRFCNKQTNLDYILHSRKNLDEYVPHVTSYYDIGKSTVSYQHIAQWCRCCLIIDLSQQLVLICQHIKDLINNSFAFGMITIPLLSRLPLHAMMVFYSEYVQRQATAHGANWIQYQLGGESYYILLACLLKDLNERNERNIDEIVWVSTESIRCQYCRNIHHTLCFFISCSRSKWELWSCCSEAAYCPLNFSDFLNRTHSSSDPPIRTSQYDSNHVKLYVVSQDWTVWLNCIMISFSGSRFYSCEFFSNNATKLIFSFQNIALQ